MEKNFTQGPIVGPLIRFTLPVLFAIFLQTMYGAVDLMVVGQFAGAADVSAVATGSQIMSTGTRLISSLAMGMTIILGQQIGRGNSRESGETIGTGIALFAMLGVIVSASLIVGAPKIAELMQAPAEAFGLTVSYIRICSTGILIIIAYNLIGSVFRGMGDSKTPLIAVAIACAANILGDLLLVAVFKMGASGAAIATVAAQGVSVAGSMIVIRRKRLPFEFRADMVRIRKDVVKNILALGVPIAVQDLLVAVSFMVITAIVNSLGIVASAGVGVAQKTCGFILLVPGAFMQSMSAFVAQNIGAEKHDRAIRTLFDGVMMSVGIGAVMFLLTFFHGDILARIFASGDEVVAAATDYLRGFALDCLLSPLFLCFVGFYNGLGMTRFVMAQGVLSAFLVRLPVSYLMSRKLPVSLAGIGLATPLASAFQAVLCISLFLRVRRDLGRRAAIKGAD